MQLGMLLICAHARNRPAKREQYLKLFATAVHKKIVMRRARIARELDQLAAAAKLCMRPKSKRP
jgi:hypothetical protein